MLNVPALSLLLESLESLKSIELDLTTFHYVRSNSMMYSVAILLLDVGVTTSFTILGEWFSKGYSILPYKDTQLNNKVMNSSKTSAKGLNILKISKEVSIVVNSTIQKAKVLSSTFIPAKSTDTISANPDGEAYVGRMLINLYAVHKDKAPLLMDVCKTYIQSGSSTLPFEEFNKLQLTISVLCFGSPRDEEFFTGVEVRFRLEQAVDKDGVAILTKEGQVCYNSYDVKPLSIATEKGFNLDFTPSSTNTLPTSKAKEDSMNF